MHANKRNILNSLFQIVSSEFCPRWSNYRCSIKKKHLFKKGNCFQNADHYLGFIQMKEKSSMHYTKNYFKSHLEMKQTSYLHLPVQRKLQNPGLYNCFERQTTFSSSKRRILFKQGRGFCVLMTKRWSTSRNNCKPVDFEVDKAKQHCTGRCK